MRRDSTVLTEERNSATEKMADDEEKRLRSCRASLKTPALFNNYTQWKHKVPFSYIKFSHDLVYFLLILLLFIASGELLQKSS